MASEVMFTVLRIDNTKSARNMIYTKKTILNSVSHWLMLFVLLFTTTTTWAADVSGTINVSSLADNAELKLTGATTLNIDVDKTIKSIRGDYTLTIQGSKTLTVNNSNGDGIAVGTLVSSAK